MKWHPKRFLVTGGAGFLGSHIVEALARRGVPPENVRIPRSDSLDLRKEGNCQKAVDGMDVVIHTAARLGGIAYNLKNPVVLLRDNLLMSLHLMEAAREAGVKKFVGIASVCAYPKFGRLPFREEDLWSGYPEESNAPYGVAKRVLAVQAQAYRDQYGFNAITLFPANLYGPRDNFDLESSHVVPALVRKMVEAVDTQAREVVVWGTGEASREFLYVEDCAEGILLATERYDKPEPVNLATGREVKIRELVQTLKEVTGFEGSIRWDTRRPDGQPRRSFDTSRAFREFEFRAKTNLQEGLEKTVRWFRERCA